MPKRAHKQIPDVNQFAATVVRRSTEDPGPVDLNDEAAIRQVMRAIGHQGGLKGAATLNARLTPAQRKASARRAAQARSGKKR